ncbi:hypothetical protein [Facklamia sp. P13055]|uniref:hypothetical protein n=1 Tax=Facklamia sp. P13055 TaxID=3421952 RepID=UPI003D16D5A2
MGAYEKFTKSITNFGRLTMVLGVIAVLLPPLTMTFVFGYNPGFAAIIAGAISQMSVSGAFYLSEPLTYFPIVGTSGLYLTMLSGNGVNMKIPAAAISSEASGYKQGTDEGALMGTIGLAVSIYVAVFFVIFATILGQTVITTLPADLAKYFELIIPGIYGAIFGQFMVKSYKTGLFALLISTVMIYIVQFIPGNPSFVITLTSIFTTILFARKQLEKGQLN